MLPLLMKRIIETVDQYDFETPSQADLSQGAEVFLFLTETVCGYGIPYPQGSCGYGISISTGSAEIDDSGDDCRR